MHPGQLNHDAVCALLLNHRLRGAELIHALVECDDILLERVIENLYACFWFERYEQPQIFAPGLCLGGGDVEAWEVFRNAVLGGRTNDFGVGIVGPIGAEPQFDRFARTQDAGVADASFTQARADLGGACLDPLEDRRAGVDLQQKVDATA